MHEGVEDVTDLILGNNWNKILLNQLLHEEIRSYFFEKIKVGEEPIDWDATW